MFVRQEFDADHHGRERTPLEFTAHRVAAFPDPVEGELMPAHCYDTERPGLSPPDQRVRQRGELHRRQADGPVEMIGIGELNGGLLRPTKVLAG